MTDIEGFVLEEVPYFTAVCHGYQSHTAPTGARDLTIPGTDCPTAQYRISPPSGTCWNKFLRFPPPVLPFHSLLLQSFIAHNTRMSTYAGAKR